MLVVDDVVSSGSSMLAVLKLLAKAGIQPVAAVLGMLQGDVWRRAIAELDAGFVERIHGAITSPRLSHSTSGGWFPAQD